MKDRAEYIDKILAASGVVRTCDFDGCDLYTGKIAKNGDKYTLVIIPEVDDCFWCFSCSLNVFYYDHVARLVDVKRFATLKSFLEHYDIIHFLLDNMNADGETVACAFFETCTFEEAFWS